jgi:transcriptional regulator with XRE-family HTH domain
VLKEHRLAKGISQAELAKALGRHQPFIATIEMNQRRIDLVELVELAAILDLDIAALVERLKQTSPD